jgi:Fe-S cluster biogenesis protein NfuA
MQTKMNLADKVNAALETVRPFLIADGGDIEIVKLEKDKLTIKFIGNCSTCSMSEMTLKAGIEAAIKNAVPEIKQVFAVV